MITWEEAEAGNEDLQRDVQNLLWWMFRAENGPRCQVKNVAPELGIAPDTLNKYTRGSLPLPAYHVPGLFNATGDRGLLTWIMSRCEGITLRELGEHRPIDGDVTDNVEQVMLAAFSLFEEKVRAFQDGELDSEEKGRLYVQGMRLSRELDGMLAKLGQEIEKDRRDRKDGKVKA